LIIFGENTSYNNFFYNIGYQIRILVKHLMTYGKVINLILNAQECEGPS